MRRFSVEIEDPLNDTIVLIPKQWAIGRVSKIKVMCGVGTKKDIEQPWVSLSLVLSIRTPDICSLVNQDEVKLDYSPYIELDKEGRAKSGNNNVDFSKMLKLCGVDLADPDVKETLREAIKNATTGEDQLKLYYEKLGDLCIGPAEYNVYIDQKTSYRDTSIKENTISKMAAISEEEEG